MNFEKERKKVHFRLEKLKDVNVKIMRLPST